MVDPVQTLLLPTLELPEKFTSVFRTVTTRVQQHIVLNAL